MTLSLNVLNVCEEKKELIIMLITISIGNKLECRNEIGYNKSDNYEFSF